MAVKDCIFCKIVAGELPAEKVYQDEMVTAFRDIHPLAPSHILIIPNEHLTTVNELISNHAEVAGRMLAIAVDLAKKEGIAERGYRLVGNVGAWGGQSVDHLHLHLMGGRAFDWPPG